MSIECSQVVKEIDCLLHDTLTPHEKSEMEEHCKHCPICQAALDEGKKRFQNLAGVAGSEAGEPLIKSTLKKIDDHEARRLRRKRILMRVAFGTAAAVVLLFAGQQIFHASLAPSPYDLRVLGQTQFIADKDAEVRVSVLKNGQRVKNVPVKIELADNQGDFTELVSCETEDDGTVQPKVHLPAWNDGTYQMRISARPGGSRHVLMQTVQLRRDWKPAQSATNWKVMLSSDRPVYQPGQKIQVRSLALGALDLKPAAKQDVVFRISDPAGNVIFKRKVVTKEYGIGACECLLAHEILEGTYTIDCQVGPSSRQKLQVEVRKYVLPAFKIDVVLDKPFFRPGESVSGKVRADYFFGKPVTEAQVELTLDLIGNGTKSQKVIVTTDDKGEAKFKLAELPASRLKLDDVIRFDLQATVNDRAGQTQTRKVPVSVTRQALHIEAVPEAGRLIHDLPNVVYVFVTSIDGQPVRQAKVSVTGVQGELLTNDLGLTQFTVTPRGDNVDWTITADDQKGQTATLRFARQVVGDADSFLFQTDKVVYQGGDVVTVDAWGGHDRPIMIDVIKDGQTLWTQMLQRRSDSLPWNGIPRTLPSLETKIQLPADMFGAIQLQAYRWQDEPASWSRPRTIQVRAPKQVNIATKMTKPEYKPGEETKIEFRLTDGDGSPVMGALSLAAVDEKVFAVLQQLPGSEAAFFTSFTESAAGAAPAEDRLLFERALVARSEQVPPGERFGAAPPKGGTAVTLSSHERNARISEEHRQILAVAMKAIWTIVAFVVGGLLALGFGILVAKFFQSLSSEEKTNWVRLTIGVLFVLFLVTMLFTALGGLGPNANKTFTNVASTMANVGGGAEKEERVVVDKFRFGTLLDDSKSMPGEKRMDDYAISSNSMIKVGIAAAPGIPAPRIRNYFPETLKWTPELITNEKGVAQWPLTMADSITTWRLSTSAVTADGRLGAGRESIKVFQPFFVELQLPIALVRNDEVAVPVIVYNYLGSEQTVAVRLEDAPWFDRLGEPNQPEARARTLKVRANDVAATSFRIRVKKAGVHEMTVFAQGSPPKGGTPTSDAIRKQIRVVPNGLAVEKPWNGALLQPKEIDILLPDSAIEDSAQLLLKIYPSTFSQALEGLDSIFRMPTGCFEQTSSSTYPNVLALDYLKRTGKNIDKVENKAREYVHLGYQRLISFEVQGGGFDWFGRPPANRTLTAYGLLEFQDMARVHDVDPKLIQRTRAWLLAQRKADGSWEPEGHVPAGLPGQGIGGEKLARLSATAYIAWATFQPNRDPQGDSLSETAPTRRFLLAHAPEQIADPHVLALLANALLGLDPTGDDARPYLKRLESLKKSSADGKHYFWQQPEGSRTTFYGSGQSGDVETTALACLAMQQARQNPLTVKAALSWLVSQRDPHGTWYSTQATVLALKALLAESLAPPAVERRIVWSFKDGKEGTIVIDADQAELMELKNLTEHLRTGANRLTLTDVSGTGVGYQVTLRYHEEAKRKKEPFTVEVAYAKNKLRIGDVLQVQATVKNEQKESAPMVMIELPVPAGFSPYFEDWNELMRKEQIARYQVEAGRILVYLRGLPAHSKIELPYRLRATMAVRIQVPAARAYEYYNPQQIGHGVIANLVVEDRAN